MYSSVRWFFITLLLATSIACSSGGDSGVNDVKPTLTISANAGGNQMVNEGDTVYLDASLSASKDASVTIDSYLWTQEGVQTVTLQNADTKIASFVAPAFQVDTDLVFSVTVQGSNREQATDSVTITVKKTQNSAPVVVVGNDIIVTSGDTVTLDGSGSSDADSGDSISSFLWEKVSGPNVVINNADQAIATFTAPSVGVVTQMQFTLTVTDTHNAQASDSIVVTVNPIVTTSEMIPFTNLDLSTTPASEQLNLIDNDNPGSITTIESGVARYSTLYTISDFDSNTQQWRNTRPAYWLYFKGDKIWRVNLQIGSTLQPQQVTSETFVSCAWQILAKNLVDPLASSIMVKTAGTDNDCNTANDNAIKLFKLGDSSSTPAADISDIVSEVYSLEFNDFGFYTVVGNTLRFYKYDLSGFTDLLVLTDTTPVYYRKNDRYQIIIADNQVISLDSDATPSASVWDSSIVYPYDMACDKTDCYFSARKTTATGNYMIYKFPADGSSPATELPGSIHANRPYSFETTANYVFYLVPDTPSGPERLYQYPRNPDANASPVALDAHILNTRYFSNEYIFYTYGDYSPIGTLLGEYVVVADETLTNKQTFANSNVVGIRKLATSALTLKPIGEIILAENANDIKLDLGGATLNAYSFATGTLTANFAVIPQGQNIVNVRVNDSQAYGANRFYVEFYFKFTDPGTQLDSYQYDIGLVDGSQISNLTNTQLVSEYIKTD